MIQFKLRKPSGLVVFKHNEKVAEIVPDNELSEGWKLVHKSGRIDRHRYLSEARSDALKL